MIPPVPAGPERVTVPVEESPPRSSVGESEMLAREGGVIVSTVENDAVPSFAVSVALVDAETATVATVNVAEVAPAATVTEAGTVAALLLEVRLTTDPLLGAGPVRVTTPDAEAPPATGFGVTLIPLRTEDVMARAADLLLPL